MRVGTLLNYVRCGELPSNKKEFAYQCKSTQK